MGFLFKSKGDKNKKDDKEKKPEASNSSDDEHSASEEGGETSQTTTPKVKRRTTVKRNLSSNSMRKIRELAACLQLMGDEVEQKRLSGAYSVASNAAFEKMQNKH
jgi:hypothetical protein